VAKGLVANQTITTALSRSLVVGVEANHIREGYCNSIRCGENFVENKERKAQFLQFCSSLKRSKFQGRTKTVLGKFQQ